MTSSSAEAEIFAVDGDPKVLDHIGCDGSFGIVLRTGRLRWGSAVAAAAVYYGSFANVIIGSNLTCNGGLWAALAETMLAILEPGGIVIYLARLHDTSFFKVPLPPRVAPSSPHLYLQSAIVLLPSWYNGMKTSRAALDSTQAAGRADPSQRREVPARGSPGGGPRGQRPRRGETQSMPTAAQGR
jgi:hypothetical protein